MAGPVDRLTTSIGAVKRVSALFVTPSTTSGGIANIYTK